MPIFDLWGNPTTVAILTMAGYTPPSSFSTRHRLFPLILSTIREMDVNDVGLIYRWLMPMDAQWIDLDARIRAIPDLRSPTNCPDSYLTYLRRDVGILDDMSYLWDVLDIDEQRRLVKNFVSICQSRSSTFGLILAMESMIGRPVKIFDYFHWRWILSGDESGEDETAIGYEIEPGDPWILTEENMPSGFRSESVQYVTFSSGGATHGNYKFQITTTMESLKNPPVPESVLVKYVPNNSIAVAKVFFDGTDYFAICNMDYTFGLDVTNLSTAVGDFLLYVEIDQYVSDIYIEDTTVSVNRYMIVALAKFSRPQSERLYIRYFSMIEDFDDIDRWDTDDATATLMDGVVNISSTGVFPNEGSFFFKNDADGNPENSWDYYEFRSRISIPEAGYETWAGPYVCHGATVVAFQVSVYSKISSVQKTPNASWRVATITMGGGGVAIVDTGTFDIFDIDVFYTIRMYMREEGGNDILTIYRDEEFVTEVLVPGHHDGSVGFVMDTHGEINVKGMITVHPTPSVYDYVGS